MTKILTVKARFVGPTRVALENGDEIDIIWDEGMWNFHYRRYYWLCLSPNFTVINAEFAGYVT